MKINVHTFYTKQVSLPFYSPVKKQIDPIKGEWGRSFRMGNTAFAPALKLSPFGTTHFLNPWQLLMVIGQFMVLQQSSFLNMPSLKADIELFPTFNKTRSLNAEDALLKKPQFSKASRPSDVLSDFSARHMDQGTSVEKNIPAPILSNTALPEMTQVTSQNTQGVLSLAEAIFSKVGGSTPFALSVVASLQMGPSLESKLESDRSTVSTPSSIEELLSLSSIPRSKQVSDLNSSSKDSNISIEEDNPIMALWERWRDLQKRRGKNFSNDIEVWQEPKNSLSRERFFEWVIENYNRGEVISCTPCKGTCRVGEHAVEEEKFLNLAKNLLRQGLITEEEIINATDVPPYMIYGLKDESMELKGGSRPVGRDEWDFLDKI